MKTYDYIVVGAGSSGAVVAGRLELGTWQSVALVDLNVDNPDRQVRLSLIE